MKLKIKSYPHPVLGNRDDVSGSGFQTALTYRNDKEFYYFSVQCWCSNSTLQQLIRGNQALYTAHFECSNTMFRQSYQTSSDEAEIKVPADDLNGPVEVNVFICASKDINNYRIVGAHEDYSNADFPIKKGDILAVGDHYVFEATKDYDALKKISSLMQIEPSSDKSDKAMAVRYELDKIRIILPQEDYKLYELQKRDPKLQHALACSIVLPVLIGAVRILSGSAEAEGYEGLRWYRLLKARLENLEVQDESDHLLIAQKILDYPLHRALESPISIDGDDEN